MEHNYQLRVLSGLHAAAWFASLCLQDQKSAIVTVKIKKEIIRQMRTADLKLVHVQWFCSAEQKKKWSNYFQNKREIIKSQHTASASTATND